jgi:putative ABC transport system permease protein
MLNRKLVREVIRSYGLLLLVTSIIAVGITCYVALQSAYHNLDLARQRYYRQCRMADFWIDLKKMPVAELDNLYRVDGVSEVHSRIQPRATVDLPDMDVPINAQVISLPDRRSAVINDIILRRGEYLGEGRRNEVIVSEKFALANEIAPGSTIHLLLNNRRQELIVVGTAISSEFTYLVSPGSLVPDPEHFGVFYVKRSFAEDVFDSEAAANQIVGRLAPESRERVDEILRKLEVALEPYGVFAATKLEFQASHQFLNNEIEGLGGIAAVLPIIFLAVAALVLNILITRMARRQRVVIGTFKAIGYSDAQIFLHFLKYGLCVGIAGGLLGSLLGYMASAGMTVVYRWFFEFPDLQSGFYWYTHAVGISVSILCAMAGSFYGARTMLKLEPAAAMRPEPPRAGGVILIEVLLAGGWRFLSAGWRMTLRGLFRNRLRTLTGMFSAMMGSGLLVSGFMMTEAQSFIIDFQFHRTLRSDVDVTFESEQGVDAFSDVRRMPGVDYAEPQFNVACTFVNGPNRRRLSIIGLKQDSRLTVPYDEQGNRIVLPTSGIVVTRRLAEVMHVEPGSRLSLIPVKGDRRLVEVTVAQVADSYLGLSAYADIHFLSELVGESLAMTGVQLQVDPRQQAALFQQLKNTPGVIGVQSRRHVIQKLQETLLQNQYVFIGVLVGFAGVIFFSSIVNASMVNLAERQREVATFCALGYTRWQIGSIFLHESLLTCLPGAVLGLPVGYGLTWLTAFSYNNDLVRIPVVTAPWVFLTTLVSAVVFALAAHSVVQWTITRMNLMDALQVME